MQIAIVGAGITGLVAARELLREGFSVALYERWPDVGGQASAFDLGNGVWIDRYYHHLFESDVHMSALHEELLPGQLEWHRSSVGMLAGGRIWPFTGPLDLLRYAPLGPLDRVRFGLSVLRLQRCTDWDWLDDTPAVEWLRGACGDAALDAVWGPLLLRKFGGEAERVPLAWLASKLALRRKLRGKSAGREMLGYPKASFQRIAWALADEIQHAGGEIELDRGVVRVERQGEGYLLRCSAPKAYRLAADAAVAAPDHDAYADVVLFTTPTFVTRRLADWPAVFAERLDDWSYRAAVVLLLELVRPFSDTYWVNVVDRDAPFLGLIEHTNLVPAERYPARYLYVSNYVAPGSPLLRMSADELLAHYAPALRRASPTFSEHFVRRRWVFREEAAQPVPRVGNRHRILPFETPRRGLFVANTTQIFPEDRGTNYSVRLGKDAAVAVTNALRARRPVAVRVA